MKKVRFTYNAGLKMMVLEISTDGGKSWDFSRGYGISSEDAVSVEAITELQRCVSLGYQFVLK